MSLGTLTVDVVGNIANFTASMEKAASVADRGARKINRQIKSIDKAGKNMFRNFTLPAGGLFIAAINEGRKFEKSMVGVAKTTNLTALQTKALGSEIRKMAQTDLPIGVNNLAAITEAAGQLGVKGTKNLLAFTDTIGKLGLASDLQGAEAAKTLARLLTVTGESSAGVTALGNVIVRLGNNFAATESEIADMATRIAQAGAAFGITSAQASGLGAAMKSVGINAELGGTQVGRVMREIESAIGSGGAELQAFADIVGVTGEELKTSFDQNATQVFVDFVGGLKGVAEEGGSVTGTLRELGLSNDRILAVLPSLVQGYDTLTDAMAQANDELGRQDALNKEATAATSIFDSSLSRLKTAFVNLGIAVSQSGVSSLVEHLVTGVTALTNAVADSNPTMLSMGVAMVAIGASIAPMLLLFTKLARGVTAMAGGWALLTASTTTATAATTAAGVAATRSAGAIRLFGAAIRLALPVFGLALTALTLFSGALSKHQEISSEVVKETDKLREADALGKAAALESASARLLKAEALIKEKEAYIELKKSQIAVDEARNGIRGKVSQDVDSTTQSLEKLKGEAKALRIEVETAAGTMDVFGGTGEKLTQTLGNTGVSLQGFIDGLRKQGEAARTSARELAGLEAVDQAFTLGIKEGHDEIKKAAIYQYDLNQAWRDGQKPSEEIKSNVDELAGAYRDLYTYSERVAEKEGGGITQAAANKTAEFNKSLDERRQKTIAAAEAQKEYTKTQEQEITVLEAKIQGGQRASDIESKYIELKGQGIDITREQIAKDIDRKASLEGIIKQKAKFTGYWDTFTSQTDSAWNNFAYQATFGAQKAKKALEDQRDDALASLDKQLREGTISEEEALKKRQELHEQYNEKISEASSSAFDNAWESITTSFQKMLVQLAADWLKSKFLKLITGAGSEGGFDISSFFGGGNGTNSSGGFDLSSLFGSGGQTYGGNSLGAYAGVLGSAGAAYGGYQYAENSDSSSGKAIGYGTAAYQGYKTYKGAQSLYAGYQASQAATAAAAGANSLGSASVSAAYTGGGAAGPAGVAAQGTASTGAAGASSSLGAAAGAAALVYFTKLYSDNNNAKKAAHAQDIFQNQVTNDRTTATGVNIRGGVDQSNGEEFRFASGARNLQSVVNAAGGGRLGSEHNVQGFIQYRDNIEAVTAAIEGYTLEIQLAQQAESAALVESLEGTVKKDDALGILAAHTKEQGLSYVLSEQLSREATVKTTQDVIAAWGTAATTTAGVTKAISDGYISAAEASENALSAASVGLISNVYGVSSAARESAARITKSFGTVETSSAAVGRALSDNLISAGEKTELGLRGSLESINASIFSVGDAARTAEGELNRLGHAARQNTGGQVSVKIGANQDLRASGTHGEFITVPPGYPNDTFSLGLTSGERYLVQTSSEAVDASASTGSGIGTNLSMAEVVAELKEVRAAINGVQGSVDSSGAVSNRELKRMRRYNRAAQRKEAA